MRAKNIPTVSLGLIGLGLWGEKLLLACRSLGITVSVTDTDPKRIKHIQKLYPNIRVLPTSDDIFDDQNITACIIATPPHTHFQLAKNALLHEKHVLVEKPITQNPTEAKQLIALAEKSARILMVDHIFLFSPVVHTIKHLLKKGTIGTVQKIISTREKGRMHPDSTVLWDLVPHDISIASFLLDANPTKGRILTCDKAENQILNDVTYQLFYPYDVLLQGHVSWITPIKKRSMEIIGDTGKIIVRWNKKTETLSHYETKRHIKKLSYAKKKHYNLKPKEEPMKTMLKHFIKSIVSNHKPCTDGYHAYDVIKAIRALDRSSQNKNTLIRI